MRKAKIFIINGIVLTSSSLLIRGVGLVFSIYVANKVGQETIGIFSLVMSIYNFAITFATSGISLACTYIVSEEFAKKNFEKGFKSVKNCITFATTLGITASILLIFLAPLISSTWLNKKISNITQYFSAWGVVYGSILMLFTILYMLTILLMEKKDKEIYKGLSDTDALTGLFNRRAFQAAVYETLLKRIAGVFIFIDVDNFKDYNDKYGHANGDLCLKHFAATMKKCFPKDSILGRYGGDEFVVYIKNAVSDDAHRYMDEFQREISHLMMSGGEHVTVSASAGGVVFIGEGEDFVSLCRSADNMLYDVKRNGKGTFKIKGAKKAC